MDLRLPPVSPGPRRLQPGARLRALVVVGTRPEAIKMAPVIRALSARPDRFDCRVCATGQHRELVDQMLAYFAITADHDLDVMTAGQSSDEVAARVLTRFTPVLRQERPDWVLVQGDTTTTVAAASAARLQGLRVAHVEAGLRTFDFAAPFPEEWNRWTVTRLADLHFAPTRRARRNLLHEGVPPDRIRVTGNTGIDSLLRTAAALQRSPDASPTHRLDDRPYLILSTAHRRENLGLRMHEICRALRIIAERHAERVRIVFPVHPRPEVGETARAWLAGVGNIDLVDPLDYPSLVQMLMRADMVISDSGGLQEEAPALGKPMLVLRDLTERPEGIRLGSARLVGTDCNRIVDETTRLMEDPEAYRRMSERRQPYGDGRAGERIADALFDLVHARTRRNLGVTAADVRTLPVRRRASC
jgi:UDP-N-acetylglucosamine 2-epimerase (non-hydrolysing)